MINRRHLSETFASLLIRQVLIFLLIVLRLVNVWHPVLWLLLALDLLTISVCWEVRIAPVNVQHRLKVLISFMDWTLILVIDILFIGTHIHSIIYNRLNVSRWLFSMSSINITIYTFLIPEYGLYHYFLFVFCQQRKLYSGWLRNRTVFRFFGFGITISVFVLWDASLNLIIDILSLVRIKHDLLSVVHCATYHRFHKWRFLFHYVRLSPFPLVLFLLHLFIAFRLEILVIIVLWYLLLKLPSFQDAVPIV